MVNAGGSPADIELLTSEGRIDMVVKLKDKIYIMEFKCNQSADKAIEQIKEKDYISRFKFQGVELYILGINFDTEKRNISEYKYEII
jgi:ATP-dependent exoDNAse (exonuclease V) beta subunit